MEDKNNKDEDIKYERCIVITTLPTEQDKVDGATNKPKIRHEEITERLREKYDFLIPKLVLNRKILEKLGVHSSEFIEFLEQAYISFQKDYDKDFDPHGDGGLIPYHFCHNRNLHGYKNLPIWKQCGYFADDVATPIYDMTYNNALLSANNSFLSAKYIDNYDLIYCLNLYPGHHARSDGYGGYCYLNNAAISARHYQLLHPNSTIAILDLDYHAGNGTQEIFYKDPSVLTISIHADPVFEYPAYSGFEDETGEGPGLGFNKNFIFGKKAKSEEYLRILSQAIDHILSFSPSIVIIPFGGDTYLHDPDASLLYGCSLDIPDYFDIGQQLRRLNLPIIITQEGGYDMSKIGIIVQSFLSGISSSSSPHFS